MAIVTLGIVPAPGLPANIAEKVKTRLEKSLNLNIEEDLSWKIEVQIDQITGAAESAKEIMNQSIRMKEKFQWQYVISLTDLPLFEDRRAVLADANSEHHAAQISLPAFGMFVTSANVEAIVIHMIKELYYTKNQHKNVQFLQDGIGIKEINRSKTIHTLSKIFKFTKVQRKKVTHSFEGLSVRFIIYPKFNSYLKLIFGMTMMNSPWSIMSSFKKVIGLAFATGSYMLIFNTLWKLSGLYELFRFLLLMIMAMSAMVAWIIIAHNLWEKKHHYQSSRLRFIYNATTITTLSISVMLFYLAMFVLFSVAVVIFVPADIFEDVLHHDIQLIDYIKLAWLVTSAATIAGAVGAGLENEDAVREVTYGYRQYIRSERVQLQEEDEEKEEQGKNNNYPRK